MTRQTPRPVPGLIRALLVDLILFVTCALVVTYAVLALPEPVAIPV